jgi:hypothetical protein
MSKSDPSFNRLVKELEVIIDKVLSPGASGASRKRKDKRFQALVLDEEELFQEISDKRSPFMIPGQETPLELRKKYARDIERDLTKLFLSTGNFKIFTAAKQKDFFNFNGRAILVSPEKKLLIFRGTDGSDHFKVLGEVMTGVRNALRNRDTSDPTRIFFNKNPQYYAELALLNTQLEAEYAQTGFANTHSTEQKNKWFQNKRKRGAEFVALKTKYPYNVEGAQAGHAFGGQVSITTGLLKNSSSMDPNNLDLNVIIQDQFPAHVEGLKKAIFEVQAADANIEYERRISRNFAEGRITILLPELALKNKQEGTEAQNKFKNLLRPRLAVLKADIVRAKGSPSFEQLLSQLIEDTFLGKKVTSKKFITKRRLKGKKSKVTVDVKTLAGTKVSTRSAPSERQAPSGPNLQDLINLINNQLHDKIRENMGKGGARQVLNYRTGRFAKSAKLQNLTASKEKNAVNAQVKYFGTPYTRFEKGGDLHKPLRDPKGIFGRSIRQILQENKLATLRRVNVKLQRIN